MDLTKIIELIKTVTVLVPIVQQLFAGATVDLTNEQRIAKLREAGIDLEADGVKWLKEHGYL